MTRVLVVDDDGDIRAVVRIVLELEGMEVVEASDGVAGLEAVRAERPDAVLLDVNMPRMDGLEMLSRLRADASLAHVPVLMLTARAHADDAVEALRAGADDHVSKPFEPRVLAARIEAVVRRGAQQRALNPLTGLPGNEAILSELSRRVAAEVPVALLYVDLDAFKPYNDHYGFLRGDAVLRLLGDLLTRATQESEQAFVGHVGGDDFVLVVPPEMAEEVASRVCETFDAQVVDLYDEEDRARGGISITDRTGELHSFGFLTVSIGIATSEGRSVNHAAELVTAATEVKQFVKSRVQTQSAFAVDRRRCAV